MLPFIFSALFFGTIFGLIAIIIGDWAQFKPYQMFMCKRGSHLYTSGRFTKKNHYFCQMRGCKIPRKHPELRSIEGGKVELGNFNF